MQSSPFSHNAPVDFIAARNVVAWTRRTRAGRLLLPPIQRSLVWKNSQILNYWDSLLRGYPAGLMMVHRSRSFQSSPLARTSEGQTCEMTSEDFQLFDGQQRLSALLLGHGYPIPLTEAIELISSAGLDQAKATLLQKHPTLREERLSAFLSALDRALNRPILFQRIDESVFTEESEYIRFFERLGQGGTALSQDELTYSIIKHHYPNVHDRMNDIMNGTAGRLASEVHLVLGAIRVAKVRSGWRPENPWEVVGRPTPGFVSRLKELPEVEAVFRELIPAAKGGLLLTLLEGIRERLVYDKERNPGGLPVMLLARMPHSLVDVLLLLADLPRSKDGSDSLPAFVLYWLLFVSDNDKAASHVYHQFLDAEQGDPADTLPLWIDQFERDGIAHAIPQLEQVKGLHEDIHAGSHRLRGWSERFTALDADAERPTGNSLRLLSTHRELIKRSLLWLQRRQLSESYPHFDPTSTEDEDLPIDLDHRIPSSTFGFHWKSRDSFIAFEDPDENFRHLRGLIGNSLGNFRWLDASENRSRGAGSLEPDLGEDHQGDEVEPWNHLIRKRPWDPDDAAAFQRLVDRRTLELCHTILEEGGISRLKSGN